jgi:response regulator RpfG family c-di-GMP phosphodiesterase
MKAQEETLLRLSKAAEFKDDDTGAHLIRMSQYTALIAQALGYDKRFVNLIRLAAVAHDIGMANSPTRNG